MHRISGALKLWRLAGKTGWISPRRLLSFCKHRDKSMRVDVDRRLGGVLVLILAGLLGGCSKSKPVNLGTASRDALESAERASLAVAPPAGRLSPTVLGQGDVKLSATHVAIARGHSVAITDATSSK